MDKFAEFMWLNSSKIVKAFYQKEKYEKDFSLLVGKKVRTLRTGFGGQGGQVLTVTAIEPSVQNPQFIQLERETREGIVKCSSQINPGHHGVWYFDFEVIDDVRFVINSDYTVTELHPTLPEGLNRLDTLIELAKIKEEKRKLLDNGKLTPTEYVNIEKELINISRSNRDLLV